MKRNVHNGYSMGGVIITVLCFFCSLAYGQQKPTGGDAHTLRVLCYNIHHAAPPSAGGEIDLDTIAAVIRAQKPDLVALQEVDVNTNRSGVFNQAEVLGEKTGLTPYFIKAIDHDGGEYGVAILSRFPMGGKGRYPLPTLAGSGGEPRVLGTAMILLPGGKQILFACTHLDAQKDPANRLAQITAIDSILHSARVPVIIAGDFNDTPGSKTIDILDKHFKRSCSNCPPTIPVNEPRKAIDFIAFSKSKKFKVINHTVIPERYASDHLPVLTEVRFK